MDVPGRRFGSGGAVLLALAALLPGCTITQVFKGSDLTPEMAASLVRGMEKGKVLEVLGPPDTVGLRMDGSVFVYRYHDADGAGLSLSAMQARARFRRESVQLDRLAVFFDKHGRVTAFGLDRWE